MADITKIRNTREAVLCAIMHNQDGPIPLWFTPTRDNPAHKRNLHSLAQELRGGPCPGVYELAGAYWKLFYKPASTGFLVQLQRQPDNWEPEKEQAKHPRAANPKAMWLAYLYAHGLARAGQPVAHNPAQPIETGYDYSEKGE